MKVDSHLMETMPKRLMQDAQTIINIVDSSVASSLQYSEPSDEAIILFKTAIQAYMKLSQQLLTLWQNSRII